MDDPFTFKKQVGKTNIEINDEYIKKQDQDNIQSKNPTIQYNTSMRY